MTAFLWIAPDRPCKAHPGQHLADFTIDYAIMESKVSMGVLIERTAFPRILGKYFDLYRPIDIAGQREIIETVSDEMASWEPLVIDGISVKPVLEAVYLSVPSRIMPGGNPGSPEPEDERLKFARSAQPSILISVAYPIKSPPKSVTITWMEDAYYEQPLVTEAGAATDPGGASGPDAGTAPPAPNPADPNAQGADATAAEPPPPEIKSVISWQENSDIFVLTQQEPSYTWHERLPPGEKPEPSLTAAEPEPVRVPVWWFVSPALLGAGAVGALAIRGKSRRSALAFAAAGCLSAAGAIGLARMTVELPITREVRPPAGEDAVAIFSAVHKNIYRAFDYESESDIYDVLSQSVDGPILGWIYNDVYESLILRDDGGAVCKIQNATILDSEPLPATEDAPAADPQFRVRCHWKVVGNVSHFGHTHQRTNEYEAIYTLARRDGAWKIIDTEVLNTQRVG